MLHSKSATDIALFWGGIGFNLVCAWNKIVASVIPADPPPATLWLLPWTWEDDANASNFLGAPAAQSIVV